MYPNLIQEKSIFQVINVAEQTGEGFTLLADPEDIFSCITVKYQLSRPRATFGITESKPNAKQDFCCKQGFQHIIATLHSSLNSLQALSDPNKKGTK